MTFELCLLRSDHVSTRNLETFVFRAGALEGFGQEGPGIDPACPKRICSASATASTFVRSKSTIGALEDFFAGGRY
jgi:hypothetical protein